MSFHASGLLGVRSPGGSHSFGCDHIPAARWSWLLPPRRPVPTQLDGRSPSRGHRHSTSGAFAQEAAVCPPHLRSRPLPCGLYPCLSASDLFHVDLHSILPRPSMQSSSGSTSCIRTRGRSPEPFLTVHPNAEECRSLLPWFVFLLFFLPWEHHPQDGGQVSPTSTTSRAAAPALRLTRRAESRPTEKALRSPSGGQCGWNT